MSSLLNQFSNLKPPGPCEDYRGLDMRNGKLQGTWSLWGQPAEGTMQGYRSGMAKFMITSKEKLETQICIRRFLDADD